MTYRHLVQHPDALDALLAQARRERAETIHRLMVLPVKRLLRMRACSSRTSSPESASSSRGAVPV